MKAARFSRFGEPEVLELVDLPDPHPGRGEVRVRVRAAGVNASDWIKRQGLMDPELPQTLGYEAAGLVDELGAGVTDTHVGDRVFGACPYGDAQAEYAILSHWAPMPDRMSFVEAAAIPAAAETAARALDQLAVTQGQTLFINGASGSVGGAAAQLAVERGARVIGSGSPASADFLSSLGVIPVAYGEGMAGRIREAAGPAGVDVALDVAGNGILPELIALTGNAGRVVTVADFVGAQTTGVRFSRGDSGRATYALAHVAERAAEGLFTVPVGATFPLTDIVGAHRAGESGQVRGKLVLTVGDDA